MESPPTKNSTSSVAAAKVKLKRGRVVMSMTDQLHSGEDQYPSWRCGRRGQLFQSLRSGGQGRLGFCLGAKAILQDSLLC